MSDPHGNTYPCNECQAGVLSLRYVTYLTWLGEEMITVPNFPAWICDMCGRREYDERAVNWLSTLLSPNAGRSTQTRRRRARPLDGNPRSMRPTTPE
jgi:YgiT-type zinc finger domain-containing protein